MTNGTSRAGASREDDATDARRSGRPEPHVKTPAYVLGGNEAGLAVVRSLGRAGIPVVSVVSTDTEHAWRSRYAGTTVVAPDPADRAEEYVAFLLALDPGVIMPTTDESLEAVSGHHGVLSGRHHVAAPDETVAARFLDKRWTSDLAEKLDVDAPRTVALDSEADLDRALAVLRFPCLLKPRESYRYNRAFGIKVDRVENADELRASWRAADELDIGMLAQELIPGPETGGVNYNVFMVDGEPVAELTSRKLRLDPPNFGYPSAVVSAPVEEVVEPGRAIVRGMGIEGFANVEFKQDERDGTYQLMEVNGRPNMSGELAVRCGIDFPVIQYRYHVTGELPASDEVGWDAGVYWFNEVADVRGLVKRWWRGEQSLLRGLKPYASKKVFASAALHDPKPILGRLGQKLGGVKGGGPKGPQAPRDGGGPRGTTT